jgi:hypothetical protein
VKRGNQLGISSQALASLVIAGTAIGGSTFAVMANTATSEINSPSISQTIDTDPSAKLPGESTAPVDEVGNPTNITPVSPTPVPTPKPTTPVVPPIDFGGNGDDEDDEDGNDDSYQGSDDDEDGGDDYGHDGYNGDDEDEEDEDEEDEEEDD